MNIGNSPINLYKRLRKNELLSSHSYQHSYAFVGVGIHALDNLYPVLAHLHVPLKYVVSGSRKTADILTASSWQCRATNDLDEVLNDPEVKGLLIAVPPQKHYELVKKSLEKHKMVFVEKPPCRTSEELADLIRFPESGSVLVGLQKRYAPACVLLKKKLKNTDHYSLHYRVGGYPEGDALLELFIHPVDLITYLFGKAEVRSIVRTKETLFLHLQHENGTVGSVELSTAYSWQQAEERLTVMANNAIYELNGLSELQLRNNPIRIAQLPVEKITGYTPRTELLFGASTFIPSVQHNNLYINGFYSEVKTFIRMCETNNLKINLSNPVALKDTYTLLEEIGRRL